MAINNQPTIKPQSVTGIFTRYIAKTLPLAFDESMSYYECLCALLEYINTTVVPALDNNAAGLAELQEFYLELQNYVNNYFENLDVQEEINNKLDQMVEDGVLDQIIEQYLNSSAIWGFDTVADMKDATNLINGSYARTLGYRNKNDNGGALYKIRNITNDDIIDEMTIIEINDSSNELIAELIDDYIIPEKLGAYGDGTHNDTLSIQTALNYCDSKNLPLNLLHTTYNINSSLTIYTGTNINGNGGTISSSNNISLISSSVVHNVKIKNLNLIGANNEEYTTNYGMNIVCYYSYFEDIKISNCYYGIYLDTTGASGTLVENKFNNITLYHCNNSFYGGSDNNNKLTDAFLTNVIINNSDSTHSAIFIGSAAGWIIENVHIYGSCTNGVRANNCSHTIINNIYCENAATNIINCGIQGDVQISNITGRLRNANVNGIKLDRNTYHATTSSALISNVYLSVESEATGAKGIYSVSSALENKLTNINFSISDTINDFVKITPTSAFNYVDNSYISKGIIESQNTIKYNGVNNIVLGYKSTFSGTTEKTIQIPLNNAVYNYSMSTINIKMVSYEYWDGSRSLNYNCNLILIDKNGTKKIKKLDESGHDSGFTTAPTYAYNTTDKTLDVTFTASAGYNGCLFANLL